MKGILRNNKNAAFIIDKRPPPPAAAAEIAAAAAAEICCTQVLVVHNSLSGCPSVLGTNERVLQGTARAEKVVIMMPFHPYHSYFSNSLAVVCN